MNLEAEITIYELGAMYMKEITVDELGAMLFGGDQTQKMKDLASFENPDNAAEVLTGAYLGEVAVLCSPVKAMKFKLGKPKVKEFTI